MSIIKNNDFANSIIRISREYYEKVFNENFDKLNIYITDNINEDAKLFIDSVDKPSANNLNGLYIEPNNLSVNSTILIKSDLFNQNGCPYIATILHELTHASDYKKFCIEYCKNNWHFLRDNTYFESMYMWSEYHARIIEIIHMRILTSILFPSQYTYDKNDIKEEFINFQLPQYNKEIIDTINHNTVTMTEIFKYCARIYVCFLYNNQLKIKESIPKCVFEYFPDILKLFYVLSPLQTYEEATKKFNFLLLMIQDFF